MTKIVICITFTVHILTYICLVLAAQPEADDEHDSLRVEIIDKPSSCSTSSQRGNVLKVHYTGYLEDDQKFDSRLESRRPLKH